MPRLTLSNVPIMSDLPPSAIAIAKMKRKFFNQLVEMMGSGKYTRVSHRLSTKPNCFCITGLLGEIAVKDNFASWEHDVIINGDYLVNQRFLVAKGSYGKEHRSALTLPQPVCDYLGIPYAEEDHLVNLNDEDPDESGSFAHLVDKVREICEKYLVEEEGVDTVAQSC